MLFVKHHSETAPLVQEGLQGAAAGWFKWMVIASAASDKRPTTHSMCFTVSSHPKVNGPFLTHP